MKIMTLFLKKVFSKKDTVKIQHEPFINKRSDYDDTFVIPKIILRRVAIQLTHELSPFVSKCWNYFFRFELLGILCAMMSEILGLIETAFNATTFDDVAKIFRMIPCLGMVILAVAKSYSMWKQRAVYENLVYEVGDMFTGDIVTEKEWKIVTNARIQLNFVVKGYYWSNNILLICFMYTPIVESFKRMFGYESQMLLHFFYWLPFDPMQPVYIDILLFIQTWQATIVIWVNVCSDLLFCAFLSHLTTQFDVLALRIERFIFVPADKQLIEYYPLSEFSKEHLKNENLENDWQEKMFKDLREIIIRHKTLIRLSGDVEAMFTFSLLLNFFNSSIILCFCGFCCVIIEKWNESAYKSFLFTSLCQTFLICSYGQKLLDSSQLVDQAIYNSGWYRAPRHIQSALIIMMHRAQKRMQVTTYGFSVVSLATFTTIIKTAWSYFTLILNAYNKD